MVYYDSAADSLKVYTGSDWEFLSTSASSSNAKTVGWPMPAGITAGTYFTGGFYIDSGTNSDFSITQTIGTAGDSYAAHAYIVLGAAAVDEITIRVSGTSITDAGVRTTSDTEDIVIPNGTAANAYFETVLKWLGQVDIDLISGTGKVCNWGYAKYWDNGNNDFTIGGFEAIWLGGASGDLDIELIHHKATGWTYGASGATYPTALAKMSDIHSTDTGVSTGLEGAFKRTGIAEPVNGSGAEGILFKVVTDTNNLLDSGSINAGITY
jgi:hypothetical protein